MKYISCVLFVLFYAIGNLLTAQSWTVLDKDSNTPIAYANIGIPEKGTGTVTNDIGQFNLTVEQSDQVYVSHMGYTTLVIAGKELLSKKAIDLVPQAVDLNEIELVEKTIGKRVTLGHKLKNKGHSIGFGSSQLGTAIGARIKIKNKTHLNSAHFHINHIDGDSMHFRVQVYDFDSEENPIPLVTENILISDSQKKGLLSIDLNKYNLVVDDTVLLTLEWVRDDGISGNQGLSFRSKKGGKNNFFTRRTSHAPFMSMKEWVSVAPNIRLGFYLMGTEINE